MASNTAAPKVPALFTKVVPGIAQSTKALSNIEHGAPSALLGDLHEEDQAAIGFRHASASTQNQHDSHLELYHSLIRVICKFS